MIKLLILTFLCATVYRAGATEIDEEGLVPHNKLTKFPYFKKIQHSADLSNGVFCSQIFPELLKQYPRIFLVPVNTQLVSQYLEAIKATPTIKNEITKFANDTLSIYACANEEKISSKFNLIYEYDLGVLRMALTSFLSIINTPSVVDNLAEWRIEAMIRSLTSIFSILSPQESNHDLYTRLPIRIMEILLFPSGKIFEHPYPDLAEWARSIPNQSGKLAFPVFALSLMHSLAFKVKAPFASQIIVAQDWQETLSTQQSITSVTQTLVQTNPSNTFSGFIAPTPKKKGKILRRFTEKLRDFEK